MSQANYGPYMECSLGLAVDLVNSENRFSGHDELTRPDELAVFLDRHKISRAAEPTADDLEQVRRLRSTLRGVFEAEDHERAVAVLNGLLAKSGARPELTNHDEGPWHLHYTPHRTPIAPRIAAESAMALSVVIAEDGFERLRLCEGDRCMDVFVDGSRNRSRRYCSPQVCGNRASVAAYRARQKTAGAVTD
jgi:predicted RNA-binding Zn ribbon-like protein